MMKEQLMDTIDFTTCYSISENICNFAGAACLSKDKKWIYLILPSICYYKIPRTMRIVKMLNKRFYLKEKINEDYKYWNSYKDTIQELSEKTIKEELNKLSR